MPEARALEDGGKFGRGNRDIDPDKLFAEGADVPVKTGGKVGTPVKAADGSVDIDVDRAAGIATLFEGWSST